MFRGSIPADLQRIISETTAKWGEPSDLYVGCSGNLTIERTVYRQKWRLHGNDVLLYTSAIGSFYAGTPLNIGLSEQGMTEFPWLRERFETDEERLATLLLTSRLAQTVGKRNPYYDRLRDAHEAQWEQMMDKTVAKLTTLAGEMKLTSFTPEDVYTWIQRVPRDAPVVMYPPFVGASKAFVRDFAKLDLIFTWPERPEFEPLEGDRLDHLYQMITDRPTWMFGVNREVSEYGDYLVGLTKTTNRGVPIFVYSSRAPKRIVTPRQPTQPLKIPHLQKADTIGDRMGLIILSEAQFSAARSMYMNPHIRPGSASLPLGVVVDGVLVGVFAFSTAPTMANWDSYIAGPHVYLLSDFPVAHSRYKHLAKLVLYAALSHEAKALVERSANRRFNSLTTTAFSKNPVSMKYRGVFKLLKRKENDALQQDWAKEINSSDAYYAQPYELQYGAMLGQWTLAEGLAMWKQKHGAKA